MGKTDNIEFLIKVWSAKESIFKALGKEGVSFSNDLEIDTINDDTYLTITVYPYFIKNLPRFITFFPYYLFVIPKLKSYLKSVINGIDYYIETKKPIPKNYFGKHSWFS